MVALGVTRHMLFRFESFLRMPLTLPTRVKTVLEQIAPTSITSTDFHQAFRVSGHHVLGQKELSMGRAGHRRVFVAELSAVVRAAGAETAKTVGLIEETRTFQR